MHAARLLSHLAALTFLAGTLPLAAQSSQPEALQAVRAAVASEMQNSQTDKSIWTYMDHDRTADKDAIYRVVETRQGDLRRMVELNGKPVTGTAEQAETQRIDTYINDSAAQARARRNGAHDDAQAAALLKMLPDAFIWSVVGQNAEFITLRFTPNPNFNPPDMQSRVMSIMGGEMMIARDGNRIRTLKGALTQEVKFGFGIFGHLDQGGTFDIERRLVGGGHWQITETHVHIGGKALLFKTIGQQEDEVKTDWKSSPASTLQEAAHFLAP
jgi:hypothetical protein